jgi:hypothetical protein
MGERSKFDVVLYIAIVYNYVLKYGIVQYSKLNRHYNLDIV